MPAQTQFIYDATQDTFSELVLANSHKGPVLVNYWSPQAGPCLKLWPDLQALSEEFKGRFLLVNVNAHREKALAQQYGITSIPTLKLYRHGRIVDQLHGAFSRHSLREWLQKHLQPAAAPEVVEALQWFKAGRTDEALTRLQALADAHEDPALRITLAKLLVQKDRWQEALQQLQDLPETQAQSGQVQHLRAHCELMLAAQASEDTLERLQQRVNETSDDLVLRLQYAARLLLDDRFEDAMQALLEIAGRDRGYADDIGFRALRLLFSMLGDQHPLTRKYRARLQELS